MSGLDGIGGKVVVDCGLVGVFCNFGVDIVFFEEVFFVSDDDG